MTQTARPPLRILVFGASLRVASLNDRLATLAAKTVADHGAAVRGQARSAQVRVGLDGRIGDPALQGWA